MARKENFEVAAIFYEMADLLEIQQNNPFRIRAFRRVAQSIENLPENVGAMLQADTLASVPGIGEGTLNRVKQILETGDCTDHAELRKQLPEGLLEMLRIEGVGPKKVRQFWTVLNISSLTELEAAATQGTLSRLPGMGEKSQAKILKGIEAYRRHSGRIRLADALPQGTALAEALVGHPAVAQVQLGGSTRRRSETIGDLDLLVASDDVNAVMDCFVALPQVREVMLRGDTKCSVHLQSGLQVDLRVVPPHCFGAALHYFTGSKMHNIAIRDRGKRRGLKISEYGVFKEGTDELLCGATEEEVFRSVGLSYIPPELREDRGEIEAAEAGTLPQLITERDLRGDLHMHTKSTDGTATAREMAEAAMALGYEYIAITDHSKAVAMARGLDSSRLLQQGQELRALEQELGSLRILRGIEVDIMKDGSLDLPLDVLAQLDWVVASIHSNFHLPEEEMTARALRALETGVVDCMGHPSGRLINERDAYPIDLDRVIHRAMELGVAMELNSFPDRLDLDAPRCRLARDLGVPVAINTDAHAVWHLAQREYGVATARRGWLGPANVLNAGPLAVIEERRADRLRRMQVQVPAEGSLDVPVAVVEAAPAPVPTRRKPTAAKTSAPTDSTTNEAAAPTAKPAPKKKLAKKKKPSV
jgi:DNA polymerase (family X)